MIDPLSRLEAAEEDVQDALERARNIVEFATRSAPTAELRVAILNNVIVSLVSIVEEGFRLLLVEYISIIEQNVGKYANLRKDLSNYNLRSASELLRQAADPSRNIDARGVVDQLAACLDEDPSFKLFKDNITLNRNNLRAKEITELASRVGIRKIWEDLASRPAIRTEFPDAQRGQVQQLAVERWNALFDERDIVVHQFSKASGWGDTIILPYVEFLSKMVGAITICLADDARNFLLEALLGPMLPRLSAEIEQIYPVIVDEILKLN